MFEEDGCEVPNEVVEDIFDSNEKVGVIMVLTAGESWTGDTALLEFMYSIFYGFQTANLELGLQTIKKILIVNF